MYRKLFVRLGTVATFAVLAFCIVIFCSCSAQKNSEDKFKFVDIFSGASNIGHTSPSVGHPLSMCKVGPQSGNES